MFKELRGNCKGTIESKLKRIIIGFNNCAYGWFMLYMCRCYMQSKANRMSDIGTIYRVDTCLLPRRVSPLCTASLLTAIKIHFRG